MYDHFMVHCFAVLEEVNMVWGHLYLLHLNTVQVVMTAQLQMETESETLSAAMANTLKVSEARETTADHEEDCFYDCDDKLPGEDEHTDVKRTERAHSDRLESDARTEKDNSVETESLENMDDTDRLCLDNTSSEDSEEHEDGSAEKRHDSLTGDPGEDNDEEQEKCERFVENDEKRESDSDSEFKEEEVKVTEYDEEYLSELEKDLTEEEKEVLLFFFTSSSACTIFHAIVIDVLTVSWYLYLLFQYNNLLYNYRAEEKRV